MRGRRYLRFEWEGRPRWGRWLGEGCARLLDGPPWGDHLEGEERPVKRLLAPVTPPNIFCIGRNYLAHAQELGHEVSPEPLVFMKPTTSVIGPDAPVVLPEARGAIDAEAELGVVIGRQCSKVSVAQALDHVFGYTCANDITARDWQRSDKQWTRAKGFDTSCPVGPYLLEGAGVDPQALEIRGWRNETLMQSSSTARMMRTVAELVSTLSQWHSLLPGTLLLTGTPAGVGAGRNPPVFLRAGDITRVEIEGLGALSNPIWG